MPGIIDSGIAQHSRSVQGVPVLGKPHDLEAFVERFEDDNAALAEIVIAQPDSTASRCWCYRE